MDPNAKLDLAEDRGENELKDIRLLSSGGITNECSTCKSARYLYLKSATDFRLHFNGNAISIGIGIGNSLTGEAMCFSPVMELSRGSLENKASLPCQLKAECIACSEA